MRLSHDVLHDALTGLSNRVMFHDRLARVLETARRHGRHAAVLYVDLDGFKSVNDQWGHAAGDLLLQQVARRLEDCVRAEDTVARLGGDEFGIVLATIERADHCEVVAGKVLSAMEQPFVLEGLLPTSRPAWARRSTRAMAPMPMRCSPRPMLRCMRPSRRAKIASASTPH